MATNLEKVSKFNVVSRDEDGSVLSKLISIPYEEVTGNQLVNAVEKNFGRPVTLRQCVAIANPGKKTAVVDTMSGVEFADENGNTFRHYNCIGVSCTVINGDEIMFKPGDKKPWIVAIQNFPSEEAYLFSSVVPEG